MPDSHPNPIDDPETRHRSHETTLVEEWEEAGEEDIPTLVLYIIVGLLLISFTLYLVVGGGHGHFH